jgi:FAD/FMN-containing dehydrogenase
MVPLPTPLLLSDLRTRASYSEGAGIYRILPQAVAVPGDIHELRRLVTWASETRTPLVPRGAGSGMPGGNVGPHVIVDVRAFRGIEIDAARRRARVGAATTWADLNASARAHGLRLPPDPSSGAFATSGGMVSTNAAGPRTVRYGSVRPWVSAIEVVGADGKARWVTRGGGSGEWYTPSADALRQVAARFPRTRKNSAGYALDVYAQSGDEVDLFIGAEGTLGFITSVEWRLDPIPPDTAGAALGFRDLAALGEAVSLLLALDPSAVELLDATLLSLIGDAGGAVPAGLACLLLVEFERETGPAARGVVGDAVRALRHLTAHVETAVDRAGLEHLWSIRRLASPALARLPETRRSLQVIEDGCVPVQRLADYVAGLRAAATARDIPVALFGHAGDGHVHVNAQPDVTRAGWRGALAGLFADVTALVARLGGTPSGEHGDGRLRAGILERYFGADGIGAFRSVKQAYDPLSIFNPGVIIPAPDWDPLADLKVGPDAAAIPHDIAARLREVETSAGWSIAKTELAVAPLTPKP